MQRSIVQCGALQCEAVVNRSSSSLTLPRSYCSSHSRSLRNLPTPRLSPSLFFPFLFLNSFLPFSSSHHSLSLSLSLLHFFSSLSGDIVASSVITPPSDSILDPVNNTPFGYATALLFFLFLSLSLSLYLYLSLALSLFSCALSISLSPPHLSISISLPLSVSLLHSRPIGALP